MRRYVIAGNWKMNLTRKEAYELAKAIKDGIVNGTKDEIILAPTFTNIEVVKKAVEGSQILISAQNICWEEKGAFTGEVSPIQIKELGCDYVIIGHSERRKIFGETDEMVNKKIKAAIKNGIKVILCVGETLDEREIGLTHNVVERQIIAGLKDITASDISNIVIAYEPVWAIGTGKTATPQQAQDVHLFIRGVMEKLYSKDLANSVRIIYGGSVKAENIDELIAEPDIDGVLVGGESLKADKFLRIIHYRPPVSR